MALDCAKRTTCELPTALNWQLACEFAKRETVELQLRFGIGNGVGIREARRIRIASDVGIVNGDVELELAVGTIAVEFWSVSNGGILALEHIPLLTLTSLHFLTIGYFAMGSTMFAIIQL